MIGSKLGNNLGVGQWTDALHNQRHNLAFWQTHP